MSLGNAKTNFAGRLVALKASWIQLAFGHTPDGARVMLVEVRQRFGNPRRRFYAVLVLHSDGRLERYRCDGKVVPLATAVYWPKPPMAERVLRGLVPRAWGSQDDSACIIKNLPVWLLRRPHGIARRVIAWKAMYERTQPRGVRMLFGYEELIDFHTWEELDMSILEAMAEKRAAMHKQQEAHSIERLRGMIIKKKANTGSNNGKTGHII